MLKDDNDNWVKDKEKLYELVSNFHKDLLALHYEWKEKDKTEISFPILNEAEIKRLGDYINNEKVNRALFSKKSWKGPGLEVSI